MIPPKLTSDLVDMVKDGDLTLEQAEQVMATSKPDPQIISLCGNLVSAVTLSPKVTGETLIIIQRHPALRYLQRNH